MQKENKKEMQNGEKKINMVNEICWVNWKQVNLKYSVILMDLFNTNLIMNVRICGRVKAIWEKFHVTMAPWVTR